jgi:uncharacterized integral membrane protein
MTSDERRPQDPAEEAPVVKDGGVPWGLALFFLLAVALVVFIAQNTQDVELRFLQWEGRFPLAVIILGVAVAAALADEVLLWVLRRRRRRRAEERAELDRLRRSQ